MNHSETRPRRRTSESGASITELVIVSAIVVMLIVVVTMALPNRFRATNAKVEKEARHQAEIARRSEPARAQVPTKDEARKAFRQVKGSGDGQTILSLMLFDVRNDEEFGAYWHTLLNPENRADARYTPSGNLVAIDAEGERFVLLRIGNGMNRMESAIVGWDFISPALSETSLANRGGNVMWSDGAEAFVLYRSMFPMTQTVADLSHRFLELNPG